jgi:uncharacterized protein
MIKQVFINLPVQNLDASVAFFTKLGFTFNAQFTDTNATCMIMGENMFAMLLVKNMFTNFTKKEIADTHKTTEVIIAMDLGSKDAVNEMVAKAKDAGGQIYDEPKDHGWMYQHCFADLDGHQWEVMWADLNLLPTP